MQENKVHVKYHILVDHKPHDWNEATITGAQLRQLAGVDSSYQAWQERHGKDDIQVGDDQSVNLAEPGAEHFFTAKKTTTEG